MAKAKPGLYGLASSNRDYEQKASWGKNCFNSGFPTSLACYMHSKGMKAVYLTVDKDMNIVKTYIGIPKLFNTDPADACFNFETPYDPYKKHVSGELPRNDLTITEKGNDSSPVGTLEIKLVAVPDESTYQEPEEKWAPEIVVRPDTIIYMACQFIEQIGRKGLKKYFGKPLPIKDWSNIKDVAPHLLTIHDTLTKIVADHHGKQQPLILEPIWKTDGKSSRLVKQCLDLFVWSNASAMRLFMDPDTDKLKKEQARVLKGKKLSRHTRTMIWLYKMLNDYYQDGIFDGNSIKDNLTYNTKNDKAFSTNGARGYTLMKSAELLRPRIKKSEIKKIVLGNGQDLLSPERRFDAIIAADSSLFEESE